MPRISYCLNWFDQNFPNFSGENENIDLCQRCWPNRLDFVPDEFKTLDATRAEAVEEGADHPSYEDTTYDCENCGCTLKARDD
jgi:hypothetical protein